MKTMVSTAGSGIPGAVDGPDALVPGAKAGPWIVERELGRGGMGAVYAVVHEDIGKRAALKVVHKHVLTPFNGDRMLLEAKVVNQVGHPNIVDIFETGKLANGLPYIVMERLDGQSLGARADEGKLLPDLVIKILLQVCDALIAAHAAGVVHRDLKLDNVFLVDNPDEPETLKVKLLDWGIAKLIHHDVKHTIEGQLVGTPQYLSPEQARGHTVTPQTDVYSLGVMAYELFLERLPFEAETAAEVMAMHLRTTPPPPSDLWPEIPARLQNLLLAMLAKQPDQRPTSLEVARQLEAVGEDIARRRHGRFEPRHRAPTPGAPTPAGSSAGSSAGRRVISSSPGFAPTEIAAARTGSKRWQYTVGVCALAVTGMLFWISRIGDHPANAATAPDSRSPMQQIQHRHAEASVSAGSDGPSAPPTASPPDRRMAPHALLRLGNRAHRAPGLASEAAASELSAPVAARAELVSITAPAISTGHVAATGTTELVSVALAAGPTANARPTMASRATESRISPARTPRPTASRVAPARQPSVAPRRGTKVDPDGTFEPYR
jgi:serine/threonine-protein kinase